MRALIQRVKSASVVVDGKTISQIGQGLCVLVGISRDDTEADSDYISNKLLNLSLFDNPETGKRWNASVPDLQLEILCVSQFTLYATLKGNKPDFRVSMESGQSRQFYDRFLAKLGERYNPEKIKNGEFGAMMEVNIVNDGPVTIDLQSPESVRLTKSKKPNNKSNAAKSSNELPQVSNNNDNNNSN